MDDAERTRIADRLHSAAIHLLRHARAEDPLMALTPARASVLSVLVFGGGERSIGELAAAEQVAAPTMTRLVSALEADGWVERRPNPDDGRVVLVAPTRRAVAALRQGRRRRVAAVGRLLGELPEGGWRAAETIADAIERALADRRPSDAASAGEPAQPSPLM